MKEKTKMCPHEEHVTAWLLGDLPPQKQREMTRHLETCADCGAVRDELARVLTPLSHALEKDSRMPIRAARPFTPPTEIRGQRFWLSRHEWLRRAALFAASFGTVFLLLNMVYRQSSVRRPDSGAVTHITFGKQEAPAPELIAPPTPSALPEKDAMSVFDPRTDRLAPPAPVVSPPALPAPEPNVPDLRKLGAPLPSTALPAADTAPRPAAPAAQATARRQEASTRTVKKERDSQPHVARRPLSGAAVSKPLTLTSTAPTNGIPTNAEPARAVKPPSRSTP